jgi:MoxR-like ATPase
MSTLSITINDLDKSALILLAKKLDLSLGDYARKPKKVIYESITEHFYPEIVQGAIDALVDEGEFSVEEETDTTSEVAEVKQNQAKMSDDLAGAMALLELLKGSKGGIDEDAVRKLIKSELSAVAPKELIITRPDLSQFKTTGHVRPEFESVLRKASCNINVLLIGPAGCGKTHLAHQVAQAMGREFASVSCTAGMSESALQGWLLPSEGGAFEYVPSDFVTMYENGGVFLFDEIDAADPNTLLFVNQALANGGFNLPQRKGKTYVKRHENFVCIGAANTYGTGSNMVYSGRERLDESTLDRFRAGMIKLDYDNKFEMSVVDTEVYNWASKVRANIIASRLNRVMSTRFMLDATKLKLAGESLAEIKETYFIGWKDEEKSKVSV